MRAFEVLEVAGFLWTIVIAKADKETLGSVWWGWWSLPFLQQLMFVLGQKWISSYRSRVSKYCPSILSNLICGSPSGTAGHNHKVNSLSELEYMATEWFDLLAQLYVLTQKYMKKLTALFFVHVTYVTLPITRLCQPVSQWYAIHYKKEVCHHTMQCWNFYTFPVKTVQ